MNKVPAKILRMSLLSRKERCRPVISRSSSCGPAYFRRAGASIYYPLCSPAPPATRIHGCPFSTPRREIGAAGRLWFRTVPGLIIPPTRRSPIMRKHLLSGILLAAAVCASVPAATQQIAGDKEQILWQKLEATIQEVDHGLDGVLGVAILDLSTGQKCFLHGDEVLPTASSIKIAILAELYHQAQQGTLKLTDLYTLEAGDLVGGSGVAGALTPGVTRLA